MAVIDFYFFSAHVSKHLSVTDLCERKCHFTYKRTIHQLIARDDEKTILQRYKSVPAWMALGIDFFFEFATLIDVFLWTNAAIHRTMNCQQVLDYRYLTIYLFKHDRQMLGLLKLKDVVISASCNSTEYQVQAFVYH